MSDRPPQVSVIMRSKNSDWVIAQSLAALFSQDFKDFELLVVDSGSTDRTVELVQQFPGRLLRIAAKDYYPGAVLNMAIEQTRGELIVFQNSDAVPLSQRTLGHLVAAFSAPEVQGAFARQIPRPEADCWVRRDYAASFPPAGPPPVWLPFSLPLAAMRRSIWQQHPFYTQAWGSEDVEWGYWAQRHGAKIRYVPKAIVMHSHNYTLRQIYGRRFIEGEADAFIHRDAVTLISTFLRILRSVASDVGPHLLDCDWLGLGSIPARRVVFHWGYYQGHQWGRKRLSRHDTDASVGQQVVLERYER